MKVSRTNLGVTSDVKNRYLSFSLGDEEYAVPLLKIKEVIAVPEITPVPFTPKHFLGIMNLRGQIISIMDLRTKFQMTTADLTEETAVIIVELDSLFLGMIVDSVDRVLNLTEADMSPPPEFFDKGKGATVTGVARKDEKLILLLDVSKTLDVDDLVAVKKGGEQNAA